MRNFGILRSNKYSLMDEKDRPPNYEELLVEVVAISPWFRVKLLYPAKDPKLPGVGKEFNITGKIEFITDLDLLESINDALFQMEDAENTFRGVVETLKDA